MAKACKGKRPQRCGMGLPAKPGDATIGRMKFVALHVVVVLFAASFGSGFAQTMAPPPPAKSQSLLLEELAKKIDEQNIKIDTLSQHILKLEQQMSNGRPGVMIGGPLPTPAAASVTVNPSSVATASPASTSASGNTHTVARGETLTSIAKLYKVTIDELQKANHIENPLKLQAGQSLIIPSPGSSSPTASPSVPPTN